jgi:hypothetical protein
MRATAKAIVRGFKLKPFLLKWFNRSGLSFDFNLQGLWNLEISSVLLEVVHFS